MALLTSTRNWRVTFLTCQARTLCTLCSLQRNAPDAVVASPTDSRPLLSLRFLIAANPQSNDNAIYQKEDEIRVVAIDPSRLDTTQSVICAVLRKYHEPHGDVHFSKHVGWFSGLLSDCHSENLDDAAYGVAHDAFAK